MYRMIHNEFAVLFTEVKDVFNNQGALTFRIIYMIA